jgi:hypothetical protein
VTPRRPAGASAPAVNLEDLSPELRAQLTKKTGRALRVRRAPAFPMEDVRRYTFRALAVLADLTRNQRRRVLSHALRVNDL